MVGGALSEEEEEEEKVGRVPHGLAASCRAMAVKIRS